MKRIVPLFVSMMLMSACSPNANTLVAAEQPKTASESKAGVSLSDISGHWAESDIKAIVAAGYVDGYPDGSFKPDHTVTRAEFITMTAKAAGLKPVPGGDNKEWHAPYVAALVQAGIHQYKDFSSGDWNTPITRMEMARLAVRASDKSLQSPEDSTDAKKFMFLATQKGLITGMADGQLGKEESATRAQSVKIIQRILDVSQGKKLEVDKRAASYAEVELTGSNVQTMWGSHVVELPYRMPLRKTKAIVKVHQVLIMDLKERDGAFRSMFDGDLRRVDGKPIGDDYFIALKIDVTNENGGESDYTLWRQLASDSGMEVNILDKTREVDKRFYSPGILSSEGWHLFVLPKEEARSQIERTGYVNLRLHENNGATINLGIKE
ncbi:S-layer homology domain-containing protein [Paenibacillus oleatilyticus]|uniref:S-layer homology domain-containing protein n=1 Tax=Paenibacillus oleatilyticus TaxID=2594886 RepID=UPI001C1F8852|nr:S-layer homology domain-containing protein [Paenibacillus oleatilyticus]MBU7318503.1 S-layer homology domain-containing protein [Paenibacillus oleatilyticus]